MIRETIYRLMILLFFLSVLSSCSVRNKGKVKNTTYKLILEENFSGTEIDRKLWSSYPSTNSKSPWNKYVKDNEELTEVKNGSLFVRASWNAKTDLPETAALYTKDQFSFKYGKIEVRARFNKSGQGGWPAIWLMPQNPIYSGWPDVGEIDIMERLNTDVHVNQVVHQSDSNSKHISTGKTPSINPENFNLYTVVKLPKRIEFYVNDVLVMVHEPSGEFAARWPFETDYYIILNHACSDKGTSGMKFWPGYVNSTDLFSYEMEVDYVKVWKTVQ